MKRAESCCVLLSMERTPGHVTGALCAFKDTCLLVLPSSYWSLRAPACTQPCPTLHLLQPSWGSQIPRTQESQLLSGDQAGRNHRVQMSWRGWPRCSWSVGVAVAPALGGGVRQEALEQAQVQGPWPSLPHPLLLSHPHLRLPAKKTLPVLLKLEVYA